MGMVTMYRCGYIVGVVVIFPYSICISFFGGSSIPTSLFIFKNVFSVLFMLFFYNIIIRKRYSKNIRDRSKKSRSREYNY